MKSQFEVAHGTIIGKLHRDEGKNNQDAFDWRSNASYTLGIVTDGCSRRMGPDGYQSTHCEVGAHIGARIITESIEHHLSRFVGRQISWGDATAQIFWERVRQDILAQITVLAKSMGKSLTEVIAEYFMFTVVGYLITPSRTSVFSIGDGVYVLNGEVNRIGPFPDNKPPYLTYAISPADISITHPELIKFQIHEVVPTDQVQSILIGTDGVVDLIDVAEKCLPGKTELVGPISQFWEDDKYFDNPDLIRRRLFLTNRDLVKVSRPERHLNRIHGLLRDDTTLVVVRRRKEIGGVADE